MVLEDVTELYVPFAAGTPASLKLLPWLTLHQRLHGDSSETSKDIAKWQQYLHGISPHKSLV